MARLFTRQLFAPSPPWNPDYPEQQTRGGIYGDESGTVICQSGFSIPQICMGKIKDTKREVNKMRDDYARTVSFPIVYHLLPLRCPLSTHNGVVGSGGWWYACM